MLSVTMTVSKQTSASPKSSLQLLVEFFQCHFEYALLGFNDKRRIQILMNRKRCGQNQPLPVIKTLVKVWLCIAVNSDDIGEKIFWYFQEV